MFVISALIIAILPIDYILDIHNYLMKKGDIA